MRKFNTVRDLIQYKLDEYDSYATGHIPPQKNTQIEDNKARTEPKRYIPSRLISNLQTKAQEPVPSFQSSETNSPSNSSFTRTPRFSKLMN